MAYKEALLDIIEVSDIDLGVRARKEYPNMDSLVLSIETRGLISPIAVLDKQKLTDRDSIKDIESNPEKRYLLLAGGRRHTAHRMMGKQHIECRIYDHNLNELEIKEIELMENIQRDNLTWQEETKLKAEIHKLMTSLYGTKTARGTKGHTMKDTAEILGESRPNLSLDLQLQKAMDAMPDLAKAKTKSDARKMLTKLNRDLDKEKQVKTIELKKSSKPEEQLKKSLANSYIVGDFFEKVKGVKDNSMDLVELDPPYGIDLSGVKKGSDENREGYNEIDAKKYSSFLDRVLPECYRVLKPNGWLIFWFAPEPWWSECLRVMGEAGFVFKAIPGIWDKGHGQTMRPELYLGNGYEMFFYARKTNSIINKQGSNNIFKHRPVPPDYKIHPTERPVEMIQDVLSTFVKPDSKVLVPFAGSGNTLLAAANHGCFAVGYDLTEEYRNDYYLRVHTGKYGEYSSYPNG